MSRYYCSGFDKNDAFGYGLGDMFKEELKNTKSIVYIPGGTDKIPKTISKYIPNFTNYFKNVGIEFENKILITLEMSKEEAKNAIKNASFVMLMGGDPFSQKEMCEKLDIINELKNYNGILLGYSAGAMLMSKYIIITPCSDEYPDFRIEEVFNFDDISIYSHNNTEDEMYPEELDADGEIYKKVDLISVAKKYDEFYLLQDYLREDGKTNVSYIKSSNGIIEKFREEDGKIWIATEDNIVLDSNKTKKI